MQRASSPTISCGGTLLLVINYCSHSYSFQLSFPFFLENQFNTLLFPTFFLLFILTHTCINQTILLKSSSLKITPLKQPLIYTFNRFNSIQAQQLRTQFFCVQNQNTNSCYYPCNHVPISPLNFSTPGTHTSHPKQLDPLWTNYSLTTIF